MVKKDKQAKLGIGPIKEKMFASDVKTNTFGWIQLLHE